MRAVTLERAQTRQGPLILVNAAHPLADNAAPELVPLGGGPRLCVLPNGRRMQVSRLPCPGEALEVELPGDCCQLSGDNAGWFILTAWEGTA